MNEESTRYLQRLDAALTDAPADLREEIVTGVREGLAGLDHDETAARIAELGDPAAIAAEAMAAEGTGTAAGPAAPVVAPARSSTVYVGATVALLVCGGYIVPVVGWLAALLLVAGSSAWTVREKKIGIVASVLCAIAAIVLLFTLRSDVAGPAGFALFLLVPLVGNLVVGFYLGLKSRTRIISASAPG